MKPCLFVFDDSPEFDGFDHESQWNGFDNVAVTQDVRDAIVVWIRESSPADSDESDNGVTDILALTPMENGLISLGWGFATQIAESSRIADRFAEVLRAWLSAEEFAEMKRRNETGEEYQNGLACASHDFCDANMAMAEAFESVMGHCPNGDSDTDCATWNRAWTLARQRALGVNGA